MTAERVEISKHMTVQEWKLAEHFYAALQDATKSTDRSRQAQGFQLGVSDLGFCSERARRQMLEIEPDDVDMLLAWLGTAIGDAAEQAFLARFPHCIKQAEVMLKLPGEHREYEMLGHPDLIDPVNGVLIDVKTDYGLTIIANTGPSDQQQYQRHCYAKAAWEEGFFPNHTLDQIRVANVWIDRAGIDRRVHVNMEPYDEQWVFRAGEWFEEVIYSYLETKAGRETIARKEPPREMCKVVCGFYESCRAYDTDVSGLLTDPTVLHALKIYVEGMKMKRIGGRLQDEGKEHLRGIDGTDGTHMLRWVTVNSEGGDSYQKIDVKEIPKPKQPAVDG